MFKFLRKTALWILLTPVALGFLGAASNQLVLNANNDTFPVRISQAKVLIREQGETKDFSDGSKLVGDVLILPDGKLMLDPVHCVMTDKTHLNFLADVIDVGDIESFGDILLDLGSWSWGYAPFAWGLVVVLRLKNEKEY